MDFIYNIYMLLFGWLPAPIQIVFFIFISVVAFWLILKLVAFIWDALPFV